jgi:hypothetical protein
MEGFMKKIILLLLIGLFVLSSCQFTPTVNNGPNSNIPPFNPDNWDDLGGGGTGDQTEENEIQSEKLSVCNNSIWTIGLSSISYPSKTVMYIDEIMEKFKPILILQKVSHYIIYLMHIYIYIDE